MQPKMYRPMRNRSRASLKGKDHDSPENDDRDYSLETGTGDEAEEGTYGCLEGLGCALPVIIQFAKEGSEERA